jgi:hypothetical protein
MQLRARMLEREKPWLKRKHCVNRIGLIITTSIAMLAAFVALMMSAIIINFQFPYEEMHACGNDKNVWLTDCKQIQLVEELPFRCCEANIPLPPENIDLRLKYLNFDPTSNAQSCGDSILYNKKAPIKYNTSRVNKCSALVNPHSCAQTLVDPTRRKDFCTWYFGYKDGSCNREIQHRNCEALETEVECNLNKGCRPNKDPWYMEAIIDSNPVSTSSGMRPLQYVGKCVLEGAPKNITAVTCGMVQNDYCGDGTGPGTAYFDHIAWETFEMTTSVGVMVLLSPMVLFFRGLRILEMEPMRKLGIYSVLIFGVLASGILSGLPFYLSRDMSNTCRFFRNPEREPIADGLNRACQSEICAMAKQAYVNEVCRLGDNILETLIMCSIGSSMSVFAAIIAHHGGNESEHFDFHHVGHDEAAQKEIKWLAERKTLEDWEAKQEERKLKIDKAKKKISEKAKAKKAREKAKKKAIARKKKYDKLQEKKQKKLDALKKARDEMRKKHSNMVK